MSADFNTYIEVHGTEKELFDILKVLHKYQTEMHEAYCNGHETEYLDNISISKEQFPNISAKQLDDFSDKDLLSYLENCNTLYVEASGPWGVFDWLNELEFPLEMASAAPNATFICVISGWNTGCLQDAEFVLAEELLKIKCSRRLDEDYDEDDDFEWDEEMTYDPIEKEVLEYIDYDD